jgi:hypothetical protein
MARFRRLICVCAIACCASAAGACAASASTFYVSARGGNDSNACTSPVEPCETINAAIDKSDLTAAPNTIEVSPEGGPYEESLELENAHNDQLTIKGEEDGVVVETGLDQPVVSTVAAAVAVTLSNLEVKVQGADPKAAIQDRGAKLTLENVEVEDESGASVNGIEVTKHGSVTMSGGGVSMENGATGAAIFGDEGALALNGVKVLSGSESEANAGGVYSEKSTLTLTNARIGIETGTSPDFDISTGSDSSVTVEKVAVKQSTDSMGVVFENSPAKVDDLQIEMLDTNSVDAALLSEAETEGAVSTFSQLETSGTWRGTSLEVAGGEATVSDSHLLNGALSEASALGYFSGGTGRGLLVQRSVLQTGPKARYGALGVRNANVTTDSSEILGGQEGIQFESTSPLTHTLTVSASTIDAGAPGIAGDAAGVTGIEAIAKTSPGSVANVTIQGSIVLEKQTASAATGDQAIVNCAYSAAPSQAQSAGGGTGAINCSTGANGNTEVSPLSALFPEPLSGYLLSPSSGALDSVPESAIALPFGLTPSTTDLEGHTRFEDVGCSTVPVQDKGALELQGHAAGCPSTTTSTTTTPSKPLVGVLSALSISPDAFLPAPSGPTVSATAANKRKKKYGTTISYRDSQVATTAFTVLRESAGRKRGKSCKKPSTKNEHGKRCTLLTKVGSFTHADRAATNSLHFSGRLNGKKLPPGTYELQAVAHDAAGNGATVEKGFKIEA